MKQNPITRPIGLEAACAEIERVCSQAPLYKRCGLRPPHLILPLDSGSGRTTFLEYMADSFRKAGVLPFRSGFEDYLEISLDGTLRSSGRPLPPLTQRRCTPTGTPTWWPWTSAPWPSI